MFNFQKNDTGKIKKTAEEFLRKIAPEAQVSVSSGDDETITIEAKVDDPQELIGTNAETLLAIQHLLRVILRKAVEAPRRIDLDINNYKQKRKEYLKELAISSANDAALSKKEISLPAMNAYERRIIHMALVDRADISTESRGQEPERRIVVKPVR
jgi:spoIIIJ-associated protein